MAVLIVHIGPTKTATLQQHLIWALHRRANAAAGQPTMIYMLLANMLCRPNKIGVCNTSSHPPSQVWVQMGCPAMHCGLLPL